MLGDTDDYGVVQIRLGHEAYGYLVEYGLKDHEAHTEQEYEPKKAHGVFQYSFLDQITAGLTVSLPEVVKCLYFRLLTHSSKPPWI